MDNKENKNSQIILPVKPDKDVFRIEREIPPPLQKPPFVHIYIGTRGAGKTNALINFCMRKNWYGDNEDDPTDKVFDDTILISSTLGSDETSRFLADKATQTYDTYDDLAIRNLIEFQKAKKKSERRHIHLIADDIITLTKPNDLIFKLTSNHRHYLTSMSFLVQAPKSIPPVAHNCATMYFIFRNPSYSEQEKIFEKLNFMGGKHNIQKLYDYATREPYCFLVVDCLKYSAWKMGTEEPQFLWSRYNEDGSYSQDFQTQ